MENNLDHNEWMNEAPYLASLPKVSPFVVPDQYFESLTRPDIRSGICG
jgi:hypothetical protein